MKKVRRMDFAELEIFIKEVFCGFSLVRREGVDFPNLRDKEFIKVYFMIIETEVNSSYSGVG